MFGLISLVILTVLLSALQLYFMDRARAASRKRTVLAAVSLVAFETFVTALAARRTVIEGSLLGLFPLVTGSMILSHLDNLT